MQERRTRSRQPKPKAQAGAPLGVDVRQEITGLLVAATGAWFLLSLAERGGELGTILGQGMRTLTGNVGAWVASTLLIWLGAFLVYLRFHRRPFTWGPRAWGLLLMGVVFELALHLFAGDLALIWENAVQGLGGGVIGWAFATPLTSLFGTGGRWVVLVAGGLVGLVMNTGLTLGGVLNWSKDRVMDGARGARGTAEDFYRLVTTRPRRELGDGEDEDEELPEEPALKRRKAATEDLNTIGASAKRGAEPGQGSVRKPAEVAAGDGRPEQPTSTEPVIRTSEPLIRGAEPVIRTQEPVVRKSGPTDAADLPNRASKSVEAVNERLRKGEEITPAKLVADTRGQLGLDPDKLGDAYQLPPISMLPKPQPKKGTSAQDHLERSQLLERTLKTFGVEARVVEISPGPAVTRFELQPGEGVRVNKFTNLSDDLALALAAEDIRIEAPIPGKAAVGIEVPNKERQMVALREVMETPTFLNSPSKLSVAFGKDNAGNPVVGDLAKMPHLLIAGSTGSGKSVCMNTIICSLLFKARPDEVKMLMIDPKMVELSTYNGIPHLIAPVIIDVKKAAGYLKGAVKEMENRYELFAAAGAKNIQQYNQMCVDDPGPDPEHPRKPLPYIVIFVDELADLMMVAPADVEDSICRLAQMARACGMHLVIATQSPRVDVITGLIKTNIPSRVAFAVSSQVDSRVIMDYAGAERLLGRGDMLYHPTGLSKAMRAQGAFIDEKQVEELVRFVKTQAQPVYTAQEVAVEVGGSKSRGASGGADDGAPSSAADAIFPQAVRVVIEHGQASVSILQRRLRCNYNKAARLIDMMEEKGFIGPHQGSKPRDVLLSLPQWHELFKDSEAAEDEAVPADE